MTERPTKIDCSPDIPVLPCREPGCTVDTNKRYRDASDAVVTACSPGHVEPGGRLADERQPYNKRQGVSYLFESSAERRHVDLDIYLEAKKASQRYVRSDIRTLAGLRPMIPGREE